MFLVSFSGILHCIWAVGGQKSKELFSWCSPFLEQHGYTKTLAVGLNLHIPSVFFCFLFYIGQADAVERSCRISGIRFPGGDRESGMLIIGDFSLIRIADLYQEEFFLLSAG